jgi:hypothetical protein
MFLIAPHLFCPKWSSFHVYRWTKGDSLHLPKKLLFWGAFKVIFGGVMGQSKWLIAKKNVQLVRHPHLLNMKMNIKCPRMESSCGADSVGRGEVG